MKKLRLIVALCLVCALMAACSSNSWTCFECEEDFRGTAYYDIFMDSEYVMCEDCARRYWLPLDFRNFRVGMPNTINSVSANETPTPEPEIIEEEPTSNQSNIIVGQFNFVPLESDEMPFRFLRGAFYRFYDDNTFFGEHPDAFRRGEYTVNGDILRMYYGDGEFLKERIISADGARLYRSRDTSYFDYIKTSDDPLPPLPMSEFREARIYIVAGFRADGIRIASYFFNADNTFDLERIGLNPVWGFYDIVGDTFFLYYADGAFHNELRIRNNGTTLHGGFQEMYRLFYD